MLEHERLWESLRSVHRSERSYRQELLTNQFLLTVLRCPHGNLMISVTLFVE